MANNAPAEPASASGAQTLGRGVQILKYLVGQTEPQRPADISRATDIDRNAVYRLLHELESHSLVCRELNGTRYREGNGLVALAAAVLQKIDIRQVAHPQMEELGRATNETVSLHIRSGRDQVCIDVVLSPEPISRVINRGETVPLYAGPMSKVILAFLDADEIQAIVKRALAIDRAKYANIHEELDFVRTHGYLASVGTRVPGVRGVAGPVFNAEGIVGSLSVSGPASRWTQQAMEDSYGLLIAACANVSAALGYSGPVIGS